MKKKSIFVEIPEGYKVISTNEKYDSDDMYKYLYINLEKEEIEKKKISSSVSINSNYAWLEFYS